ncbi:aquaporin-9-like [Oppia nitens]|uniref:aquaporin-9-like n=1 Tax=Oppia nitens TaxID=1686743 RepID=UPI0023DC47F9|nr:aquaporin-9-like [Oppia nitens]
MTNKMSYMAIDMDLYDVPKNKQQIIKYKSLYFRDFLAELFGTFVMNLLVTGCAASYTLKGHNSVSDLLGSAIGTAIGVLLGVSLTISISGAHLNPIVTIGLTLIGKFSHKKIVTYLLAQYLGALLATALVFANYYNAIDFFDSGIRSAYGHHTSTAHIFTTFPDSTATLTTILMDQIICATIVMVFVMAVLDDRNLQIPQYMVPVLISLIISGIVISFGVNCGAALNPARDLSARCFLTFVGYGNDVFSPLNGLYWLIGGVVGPHLGALIGCSLYLLFIELHHTNNKHETIALIQPTN